MSHFHRQTVVFTKSKVSKYGVFSGLYLPVFGPEKTPYLDTFHVVFCLPKLNHTMFMWLREQYLFNKTKKKA